MRAIREVFLSVQARAERDLKRLGELEPGLAISPVITWACVTRLGFGEFMGLPRISRPRDDKTTRQTHRVHFGRWRRSRLGLAVGHSNLDLKDFAEVTRPPAGLKT